MDSSDKKYKIILFNLIYNIWQLKRGGLYGEKSIKLSMFLNIWDWEIDYFILVKLFNSDKHENGKKSFL